MSGKLRVRLKSDRLNSVETKPRNEEHPIGLGRCKTLIELDGDLVDVYEKRLNHRTVTEAGTASCFSVSYRFKHRTYSAFVAVEELYKSRGS